MGIFMFAINFFSEKIPSDITLWGRILIMRPEVQKKLEWESTDAIVGVSRLWFQILHWKCSTQISRCKLAADLSKNMSFA